MRFMRRLRFWSYHCFVAPIKRASALAEQKAIQREKGTFKSQAAANVADKPIDLSVHGRLESLGKSGFNPTHGSPNDYLPEGNCGWTTGGLVGKGDDAKKMGLLDPND